jgi:hypothetical protein
VDVQSAKLAAGVFSVKSDYAVEVHLSEAAVVLTGPSTAPSTAATAISHDTSLVFVSWTPPGWRVVEVGAP